MDVLFPVTQGPMGFSRSSGRGTVSLPGQPETQQPHYRPLSDQEAQLLYAIWRLRGKVNRITTRHLQTELCWSAETVRHVISHLQEISPEYVKTEYLRKGRGHPVMVFSLAEDDLVELPVTAFIVLELIDVSSETHGLVDRDQFERHLATSYLPLQDLPLVRNRIEFLVTKRYIQEVTQKFIRADSRARYEQEYLKRFLSQKCDWR
jgi:hypothetical protein